MTPPFVLDSGDPVPAPTGLPTLNTTVSWHPSRANIGANSGRTFTIASHLAMGSGISVVSTRSHWAFWVVGEDAAIGLAATVGEREANAPTQSANAKTIAKTALDLMSGILFL